MSSVPLPVPSTFREDFPEFSNTTIYTDGMINFWLNIGNIRMTPAATRWGALYNAGLELFVAHFISIQALNQMQAATNSGTGVPGMQRGAIASESAEISVGYDVAAVTIEAAGQWNLTTYGTQFMELVNLVGMGPIQVTAGWFTGMQTNGLGWPFFPC
jgi:hypothetical protein